MALNSLLNMKNIWKSPGNSIGFTEGLELLRLRAEVGGGAVPAASPSQVGSGGMGGAPGQSLLGKMMDDWLVVWNMTFILPYIYIYRIIIPIDELIFFRGLGTTNQMMMDEYENDWPLRVLVFQRYSLIYGMEWL